MKHAFLAVMLLAAVTTGVVRAAETNPPPEAPKVPPTGTPKIQFDKTVYDFGTTSQVTSVTGTFTFHNAGDCRIETSKAGAILRLYRGRGETRFAQSPVKKANWSSRLIWERRKGRWKNISTFRPTIRKLQTSTSALR